MIGQLGEQLSSTAQDLMQEQNSNLLMKELLVQSVDNSGFFDFLSKVQKNDSLDIFLKIEQMNMQ